MPVNIPLIDILCHPWFREGFIEAARGLPSHFDSYKQTDERDKWLYECGRKVASEARGDKGRVPPLWCETDEGLVINPQVISLAGTMFLTGAFA